MWALTVRWEALGGFLFAQERILKTEFTKGGKISKEMFVSSGRGGDPGAKKTA